MIKLIIGAVASITVAVVVVGTAQRRAQLREEMRALSEQVSDIAALRSENGRLKQLQTESGSTQRLEGDQLLELLRLRAESSLLRQKLANSGRPDANRSIQQAAPASDAGLVYVDQYSGRPLDVPEHPRLRPAYEMAKRGELTGLKKELNEHPEFLNLPVGHAGSTMLHTAALNGQPPVIEELLRRGANVNALNKAGQTPLYNSIDTGNRESALLLLQAGATVTIAPPGGLAPLELAVTRQRSELAILLRQWGARE